jgi:hypothetical protein
MSPQREKIRFALVKLVNDSLILFLCFLFTPGIPDCQLSLPPLVLGYVGFRSQYCATAENYSELYGKDGALVHILIFLAYLTQS